MQNNNLVAIKTTDKISPEIYFYRQPADSSKACYIKVGFTENPLQTSPASSKALFSLSARLSNSEKSENTRYLSSDQFNGFLSLLRQELGEANCLEQDGNFWVKASEQELAKLAQSYLNSLDKNSRGSLSYKLRKEQQEAVDKTLAYMQENPAQNNKFLWNAKPRFGKTLTTYDLARQMDAKNVLILTNRPAIANSWFEDFAKFIRDKTNYDFVSSTDQLNKERKNGLVLDYPHFKEKYAKDTSRGMIAFVSLQDLKGAKCFGGEYDKLEWVKDLDWLANAEAQWDLLVIDESHEGVDTDKTKFALNQIPRKFNLHLSGTPFKAIAKEDFAEEAIYTWSYTDEQQAKAKHSGTSNNVYEKLPKLNLFTYQLSNVITRQINEGVEVDGKTVDYTFSLNDFFATNNRKEFIHEKEVTKWLDNLCKNKNYPFAERFRDELKHTFWLFEYRSSVKAMAKLLKAHPVFKDYEIIQAIGEDKEDLSLDNIDKIEKSLEKVKRAIKKSDKTITLSVCQLTTGVTIPEWTGVLMLSDIKSAALYMQAAFRSQNPWEYTVDGEKFRKENAYVFDFAPQRTLIIYDEFANHQSKQVVKGAATSSEREENITNLLNFFPVISEDSNGIMIPLDANKLIMLPREIKARSVVNNGFISNYLFKNIDRLLRLKGENRASTLTLINKLSVQEDKPNGKKQKANTADLNEIKDPDYYIDESAVAATKLVNTPKIISKEKLIELYREYNSEQTETNSIENEQDFLNHIRKFFFRALKIEYTLEAEVLEENDSIIDSGIVKAINEIKKNYSDFSSLKREILNENENERKIFVEIVRPYIHDVYLKIRDKKLKEENKKLKETKEDHEKKIRQHLLGLSRSIPALLMAYGSENTSLENFEQHIDPAVFKEVTEISIEEFQFLRDFQGEDFDGKGFFDVDVFNDSIKEFMNKKAELANYFEDTSEDIFDYIPPQRTNLIFTPKQVIQMMLDKMEEQDPEIFHSKDRTFADLYIKSGMYLTEIVKRLYQSEKIKEQIPDDKARIKHILENQIFGFAPSKIIHCIATNFIFGFDDNAKDHINRSHIVCYDTTDIAKISDEHKRQQAFDQMLLEQFRDDEKTLKALGYNQ